jgi:tRNA (mo5U34)-methyltransferase
MATGAYDSTMDLEDLQARVHEVGWFHCIDLGGGIVTPGASTSPLSSDQFPDFTGRSVLDIGAWDGYYSFLAEQGGARSVTALDHYVWGVDIYERQMYWGECAVRGELPDHSRDLTDFWRPDLPGQRAFNLAKEALQSKVEAVVADFMTVDLATLGRFDVVLYLGVLYHMQEPLTALERVRKVTERVAVVETEAVHVPGYEDVELIRFVAGNEINADFGNWYVPSLAGLRSLCRAAGFREVVTVQGPPPSSDGGATRARRNAAPAATRYRAVVHAFV